MMIQNWNDWSYVCQGLSTVAYLNLSIYSVSSFTFILIGLFLFNKQVHQTLLLNIAKDCSYKRLLFIVFGINDTILQKKDLLFSHTIQNPWSTKTVLCGDVWWCYWIREFFLLFIEIPDFITHPFLYILRRPSSSNALVLVFLFLCLP